MEQCVFCDIIAGKLPATVLFRDTQCIAFHDIHPKSPVHLLVCPRRHIPSLRELKKEDERIMGKMMRAVQKAAEQTGIHDSGYKVVINNGKSAGQMVFHVHAHVLGGWTNPKTWSV